MYLHENKSLFKKIIEQTQSKTRYAQEVIEKDYYVTMILKLIEQKR